MPMLSGRVVDTDGAPVVGATVAFNGTRVTTRNSGRFLMTGVAAGAAGPVEITAPGYAPFSVVKTSRQQNTVVFASLLKADTSATINPAAGGTVTTPDGASVTFPRMSGLSENLIVTLTHLDADTDELLAAPGNFTGIDSQGSAAVLISQGMLDVQIKDASTGRDYSLAGKGPFTIRMPASDIQNAPAAIPLWYYDVVAGKRREEGSAQLSANGVYQGQVSHFTWWNLDAKADSFACTHLTITDPSNPSKLPGNDYTIELIAGTTAYRADLIRLIGLDIINIPAGNDVTITVTNQTTGYTGTVDYYLPPFSAPSAAQSVMSPKMATNNSPRSAVIPIPTLCDSPEVNVVLAPPAS